MFVVKKSWSDWRDWRYLWALCRRLFTLVAPHAKSAARKGGAGQAMMQKQRQRTPQNILETRATLQSQKPLAMMLSQFSSYSKHYWPRIVLSSLRVTDICFTLHTMQFSGQRIEWGILGPNNLLSLRTIQFFNQETKWHIVLSESLILVYISLET